MIFSFCAKNVPRVGFNQRDFNFLKVRNHPVNWGKFMTSSNDEN